MFHVVGIGAGYEIGTDRVVLGDENERRALLEEEGVVFQG